MSPSQPKRLLAILDGYGIIHRAYHALKDNPLVVRRTGEEVSAVFGFTNTLLSVIDDLKPSHVVVALDVPGPTFRHEKDVAYKATRFEAVKAQVLRSLAGIEGLSEKAKLDIAEAVSTAESRAQIRERFAAAAEAAAATPEAERALMRVLEPVQAAWEISAQTDRCLEIMDALQIPVYAAPGYEADDVMGALSVQAAEAGIDTFLVTLDSDIVQLIRPSVRVYMLRPYQRDKVIYDEASARERYGFDPRRMADFKALRGDVSDNIPGVPGIGDTTAKKLLGQFGSIDGIYEHIDEVTPEKTRRLLREYEAQVRHAVDLATIRTDLPGVALDLESARVGRYDRQRVLELFRDLEFRSLVPRLPPVEAAPAPAAAAGEAPTAAVENYHLVASAEELDAMAAALRAAGGFAWDLEVARSGAFDHVIVGLSFAGREGEAYYVPVGTRLRLDDAPPLAIEAVIERLAPLLADRAIGKTAHNGKFDVRLLLERGLEVDGFEFDTLIAAYLLGEGGGAEAGRGAGSLNLKWLVSRRLGLEMKEVSALLGTGTRQLGIDQVRPADALPYVCANVDMTLRLRAPLEKELRDQGMWELFREMEVPLIPVLARMEAVGIALDIPVLREMARGMDDQIRYLEERAYAEVGHEFNLGSPPQLSQVLFEELSLPKTRRTKQGYSTDAQAIEALRGVHPVIDILLEWRQLTKLKSTYIDTLPGLVNPRTGRIHTTFNQAVAATGRLSSNDPNLQNIPVRSELGGQVRRAFVARDIGEDPYLLSADYSQIELRILAHLSQDPGLLEAFRLDEDIHAATASQVFGVPIEAVTREQRSRAKVFNFGVLYGLTDFGLATRERISREEASEFIRRYFEKYAAVKAWREGVIASTRRNGYAETLAGRRRYIPDIHSSNFNVRSAAERVAVNMPVQGTASDIIKIAMNRIDAELRERRFQSKMLLQVHDELIFEGPRSELEDLRELALRVMPASMELAVPLKVDVKVGKNWGDME